MAAKQGRLPAYHKRAIADEFFGLMMAGHDTTATTVAWGVKFLTDNKASQDRLRAELHAAIPQAVQDKRAPTYQELLKVHAPYLDAVVDEVLRLANTMHSSHGSPCRIPRSWGITFLKEPTSSSWPTVLAIWNPTCLWMTLCGARAHEAMVARVTPSQGCGMMPISLPSSLKDGWSSTQILARRCMTP